MRVEMRAHDLAQPLPVSADDEANLHVRIGVRRNRVDRLSGLPVLNASTSMLFQPITRSVGVNPGSP